MLCKNSSIVKGFAGASTRIIATFFFAPWDGHNPPWQFIIGTPLMHALSDFLVIHTLAFGVSEDGGSCVGNGDGYGCGALVTTAAAAR